MRRLLLCLVLVLPACEQVDRRDPPPKREPVAPRVVPDDDCPDGRCPRLPRRKPRLFEAGIGGIESPDGAERMNAQLPGEMHQRNTGGSDGAGLCVFASMRHTGLYQGDELFAKVFNYMKRYPGGGYPEKVKAVLSRASRELGVPEPEYLQFEVPAGQSNDALELLKLASKNRYMPAVTYGRSPTGRYGGQLIYHMVNLPHASDKWFAVLDNNYPGSDKYEWMSPEQFRKAHAATGSCWSIILLTPTPPPAPHNGD